MEGKKMIFRTAMRPGNRRALADKPEGLENQVESAKSHHIRALPRPKAERGGATRLSNPSGQLNRSSAFRTSG
jgi:hypothetical protein